MIVGRKSSLNVLRPRSKFMLQCRWFHQLSKMFVPSGTITTTPLEKGGGGKGHGLLLKAGMVRQNSSGVFSVLPLGQLVVDKLERHIDSFMQGLGASKLSLPTLAQKSLWTQSGRWESSGKELFKLVDRNASELCLSPTHEEAVTKLVAAEVNGYKQLPVRVYQINRKYRDEPRPRAGLLRGKEFLMKDLYTFDDGVEAAQKTYQDVKSAYDQLFKSLDLPMMVAEADSGNIGGNLSHEYHLPASIGEDTLLKCSECEYTANQELARARLPDSDSDDSLKIHRFAHGIYRDTVVFEVQIPRGGKVNMIQALRQAQKCDSSVTHLIPLRSDDTNPVNARALIHKLNNECLTQVNAGDACPECNDGHLEDVQAIEIGHIFHLGTKYSRAMNFKYSTADNTINYPEMGCHGIGISRLIAAIAEVRSDKFGLNWPAPIAPFKRVIVVECGLESKAIEIARQGAFAIDAIDDRSGKSVGYKVKELQLIGVPHIIVIGKRFLKNNGQKQDSVIQDFDNVVIEKVMERGHGERLWEKKTLSEWQRNET